MKKILFSTLLILVAVTSFGQGSWFTNFDPPDTYTYDSNRFYIDRIANPNCKWQIGHPSKTVFKSAHSNPNALVTDTLNALPPNDTSVIYVKHIRRIQPFHVFSLFFSFQLDGDSTDFATIEISPDTGHTWINVLTQDTTYKMRWVPSKPKLKGSTNGWQSFSLNMIDWASSSQGFPVLMTADTILFRFTYITDSSSAPHDGWMIDDFQVNDWFEGIQDIQNNDLVTIFPNPVSEELFIQQKGDVGQLSIQVFDFTGRLIFENLNFTEQTIDTKQLSNGVYILKYANAETYSLKKFIVQH